MGHIPDGPARVDALVTSPPRRLPRVAVLDDYHDVALCCADWSVLDGRAAVTTFTDHLADEDAVADRLADFDILVAMRERTPFPRSLLARLPRLRLLVSTGSANAAIDADAAREQGVAVRHTGGGLGSAATVELTWGLILALARAIPGEHGRVRAGAWQGALGTMLRGKVLGVVGLGNIGAQVARIAPAFGMSPVGWSRNLTAEHAERLGVRLLERREFFATADVVSLHIKLSARSRGYVGADDLRAMKPSALLVNTSRGPLIDEGVLVRALREHWIGGAALDVFDTEPLPADHVLRRLDNVLLSPHNGYVTAESYADWYGRAVGEIDAFLTSGE